MPINYNNWNAGLNLLLERFHTFLNMIKNFYFMWTVIFPIFTLGLKVNTTLISIFLRISADKKIEVK